MSTRHVPSFLRRSNLTSQFPFPTPGRQLRNTHLLQHTHQHHRAQHLRHASTSSLRSHLTTNSTLLKTLTHIQTALGILLTYHITTTYFYTFSFTWGVSMLPTIASDGDCVLISKYHHHGRAIKPGDLVSFQHPLRTDMRAIKRVVALEGDFVLRDTPDKGKGMMVQVPEGHCWVVGDNLGHSRDSRMFGPLPMALIKGKVVAKLRWRGWGLPRVERFGEGLVDVQEEG